MNYVVIDCETGGRDRDKNPITQIALQVLEPVEFSTIHSFDTLVKPYDNLLIEKEAVDYTRVNMKDVMQRGVDVNVLVKNLIETAKIANKSGKSATRPILIGHNIAFDKGFLEYVLTYKNKNLYEHYSIESFDTMNMMKLMEGGLKRKPGEVSRYTLTACCERNGIKLQSAHGAVADVEATKQLFIVLANRLRNNQSGYATMDYGEKDGSPNENRRKSRDSFFFEI